MLRGTIARFSALRLQVKAMVFLVWIYSLAGSLAGAFVQIFLYKQFASVSLNMTATMVMFTGAAVGFCLMGYIAARFRLNIKNGFFLGFLALSSSFILLLTTSSQAGAYSFMFLNGIGNGLFWLTIHSFELTETRDEERDFYASLLSAGDQMLSLAGPALATLLLWISGDVLNFKSFTLLFITTPFVYLLSFFFLSRISDYRPHPIEWKEVKHFFGERKNRTMQIYTMGGAFQHILGGTIVPLATLFLLGSELRVGLYNTIFAVVSALFLLKVSSYRNTGNRLFIFSLTVILLAGNTFLFGYIFTITSLVAYSIVKSLFAPLMGVSAHVIDLFTMESLAHPEKDFYATMIFRDLSLWFWRLVGGSLFLVIIKNFGTEQGELKTGLFLLGTSYIMTLLGATLLLKKQQGQIFQAFPVFASYARKLLLLPFPKRRG